MMHYKQKAIALDKLCDLDNVAHGIIPAGAELICMCVTDKPVKTIWGGPPVRIATVVYKGEWYAVKDYKIRIVPQTGIALEELSNEDWKTQLARGYPNVPKGAEVKVIDTEFKNLYGHFFKIEWNDNTYYVSPERVKTELE